MRFNPSKSSLILSAGLYLLILCSFIVYTVVVVDNAKETIVNETLSRIQANADYGARYIDGETRIVESAARAYAEGARLDEAAGMKDRARVEAVLAKAREAMPDTCSVAIYLRDGSLLAVYPSNVSAEANAAKDPWFREASTHSAVFVDRLPAKTCLPGADQSSPGGMVVAVAIRLDERHPQSGFLLAAIKPASVKRWVADLRMSNPYVYVLDQDGSDITQTDSAPPELVNRYRTELKYILSEQQTRSNAIEAGAGRKILIGYGKPKVRGWTVLYAQDENRILESINAVVSKFAILLLPMLAAISLVIYILNKLYARQETLGRELEQRALEVQKANQIRSEFLANVSHDLRTPLTTMSIALSGLLDTDSAWDREVAHEAVQFVSDEIDLLEARVRNLLEMSRLEANAQPPRMYEVDLTDVIGAALERLQPLLTKRPLDLDYPTDPLLVRCDPSQIEIVVLNLIENAVKYSEPDEPLKLVIERKPESILFAVEDGGKGITPGQEEKIFEKFYRGGHGASHGTGLGLAICKTIIAAHGGEIGAGNRDNRGARFWFTLPSI